MATASSSSDAAAGAPTLALWKDGVRLDVITLGPGRTHTIGRSEDAEIVVEHPSCSRRHASLHVDAHTLSVSLTDEASAQGTYVDNIALAPHQRKELHDGAKLQFGASSRSYLLQLPAAAAVAAPPPPRSSGLSANEKRKLLWGGKKRSAASGSAGGSAAWAEQAAGALGDSERAGRFLSLVGANKRQRGASADRGEGGGAAPPDDGAYAGPRDDRPAPRAPAPRDAEAARQQQARMFADLERQFEQARGGRRAM